jgi:hypothetical protein
MDEFFFSFDLGNKKSLCIGSITRKEAANLSDSALGDGTGLYLFLTSSLDDQDIKVLARLGSYEHACTFANMIRAGRIPFGENCQMQPTQA